MSRVKEALVIALSRRAPPFFLLCCACTSLLLVPYSLLADSWDATRFLWLIPIGLVTASHSILSYYLSTSSTLSLVFAPRISNALKISSIVFGSVAGAGIHMCLWGADVSFLGTSSLAGAAAFLYYSSSLRPLLFESLVAPYSARSLAAILSSLAVRILQGRDSLLFLSAVVLLFKFSSLMVVVCLFLLPYVTDAVLIITLLHPLNFGKLQLLLPSAASDSLLCDAIKQLAPTQDYSPLRNLLESSASASGKPLWKEVLLVLQKYSIGVSDDIERSLSSKSILELRRPLAIFSLPCSAVTALALADLISILRYDPSARKQLFASPSSSIDTCHALLSHLQHCTLQLQCVVAHMLCSASPSQASSSLPSTTAFTSLLEQKTKLLSSPMNKLLLFIFPPVLTSQPLSATATTSLSHSAEAVSLLLLQALSCDKSRVLHHMLPTALSVLCGLSLALQDFARACNLHQHVLKQKNTTGRGRFIDTTNVSLTGASLIVEESINRLVIGYQDVIPSYSFPAEYAILLKNKMTSIGRH